MFWRTELSRCYYAIFTNGLANTELNSRYLQQGCGNASSQNLYCNTQLISNPPHVIPILLSQKNSQFANSLRLPKFQLFLFSRFCQHEERPRFKKSCDKVRMYKTAYIKNTSSSGLITSDSLHVYVCEQDLLLSKLMKRFPTHIEQGCDKPVHLLLLIIKNFCCSCCSSLKILLSSQPSLNASWTRTSFRYGLKKWMSSPTR